MRYRLTDDTVHGLLHQIAPNPLPQPATAAPR